MAEVAANRVVVANVAQLNRAGATEFIRAGLEAITSHGRFAVALAGGNTPRGVYSLIADEFRDALPWQKVFVFFGDERHVPPDHSDSNYRMANESLLSRLPVPSENIFRIEAELPAEEAATRYEQRLRSFFAIQDEEWPRFDLILLGMGNDGHTASLFPGTKALSEDKKWVVANHVERLQTDRITLTFPVLNHAAEVVFLIAGDTKAAVLSQIFRSPDSAQFAIQSVRPLNGRVVWIMDEAAARGI